MMTTTPGKLNGLTRAANSSGVFTIFAIDHRDAMRAVLDPEDPDGVSDGVLTAMKLEFAEAMGSEASAVLLRHRMLGLRGSAHQRPPTRYIVPCCP